MGKHNELVFFSTNFSKSVAKEDILQDAGIAFKRSPLMYSVVVFYNDQEETLTIRYATSTTKRYNTVTEEEFTKQVMKSFPIEDFSRVVCFAQPTLDVLLDASYGFIYKLSLNASKKFTFMELDDVIQECYLCIITIYNKGYYIHKNLIVKSFENHMNHNFRRMSRFPMETISLDAGVGESDDGSLEKLSLKDTIEDEYESDMMKEYARNDSVETMFREVKQFVVREFGERQFEQLMRDYTMKHTNNWSIGLMRLVRKKLAESGITFDQLKEKYF